MPCNASKITKVFFLLVPIGSAEVAMQVRRNRAKIVLAPSVAE
jgi:hypothetical protein